MSKSDDFVHFHVHSDMSQLDGCGKMADYIQETKDRGMPAIAFTEHGSMRGYYLQQQECREKGVKPIYGIEFYVANDMNRKGLTAEEKADITKGLKSASAKEAIREYEDKHGIRDRWHITVWAKNMVGLKNLYKLSSDSYTNGFYYKPRIDLKALMEHGEGLAVATGCLTSPINDRITSGKRGMALEIADKLRERFGEDLWIEMQPHAIKDQAVANSFALELKDRWGKHARLLATQDAHYVHEEDWQSHEVLLCIGTNDYMSDPNRFKFDGHEFHMKNRKQMWDSFKRNNTISDQFVKEALDNTMLLNSMIEDDIIKIDRFKCLMPEVDLPSEFPHGAEGEYAYLKQLCRNGWDWREMPRRIRAHASRTGMSLQQVKKLYLDRVTRELEALEKQKFIGYFLLVHDLYGWVRKQGIACGPGRGSAAGSIVSFLLGVTSVDPIEHGLIFERFISPNRVDMPDIDMDFEDVRRHEIIDYLRLKYGEDKVCQIATVGKLSGKQCLKDVSRVLEVPYMEVSQVTNSIIERSSGDERASQTIEDSFREFKVCQEFNKKYPDVLKYSKKLEGMAKNLGIHAAGVVASPVPLTELIPLEIRKHEGRDIKVSAIDMYGVAAMGLLKLDVLGLRTLTVLNDCVMAVKERHGVEIDLEALDLNEPEVLQGFTDHDYVGIFQYDSPGADKICSGVKFEHFEDVAAMTALNRPGTARSGLATQYVARKKNPKLIKQSAFGHPKVDEITADTLGIIVYQEHVLKIFTEVAGFEPGTADSLRKKIAKKWGDESIGKERQNFIDGAKKTCDMDAKTAGKIMDAITFFGSYGFNKSHATAYGIIAYWGMWLKRKYPIEFYWALLKAEPARIRIQQIAKDAKKKKIELLPPSVSVSKKHFAIDSEANAIRGSLVDIKGVGEAAATSIMDNQPYTGLFDFLKRIDRRKVHKGVILALARAGALEDILPNVKWFIENIEDFWKAYNKGDVKGLKAMLETAVNVPDYAEEERGLIASHVNPLAFGRHPIDAYGEFMKNHVKVPIVAMSDEDFFKRCDNKGVFIAGVIVEVKYNQVGDFHTGDLPSFDERKKMFWGARYANVNVEDGGGKQNRIKIDFDIFDDFREVVDCGIGTPVIVHATANARFENLRGHFMVDLEKYRRKIQDKQELTVWESILNSEHPTAVYPWKQGITEYKARGGKEYKISNLDNRIHNSAFFHEASAMFTGIVTHVRLKYDKRDNEMAFFGLMGADGVFIDAICFGSNWTREVKKVIKAGTHMKIQLDREYSGKHWQYFFNGGRIKLLHKSATLGSQP